MALSNDAAARAASTLLLGARRRSRARLGPLALLVGLTAFEFGLLTTTCLGIGVYYRGVIPMFGSRDALTIDELTVIAAMDRAQSKGHPVEIVFTGGSTCHRGINPKLFEKLTGMTAYNYASNRSAGMRVWYWTCQAYLENHPAPRAVVLCLSPYDIMCTRGEKPRTSHDTLNPDDLDERFALAYGPYLPFLEIVLSRGTRWQKYYIDRGLRIVGSGLLELTPGYVDPRNRAIYGGSGEGYDSEKRRLFDAGGFRSLWQPATVVDASGVVYRDGKRQGPLPLTQSVIPLSEDYVRAYARLTQEHRTRLLFCVSPISREAKFDTTGLVTWMRRLQREYPHVSLVYPDVALYDPDLFWDQHHVNYRGSDRFTADVAKRVVELLKSGQAQTVPR